MKLYWTDEANELTNTCSAPAGTMIFNGAPTQCSPQPLYYVLQRAVVRGFADTFQPLVTARLVSLLSSLLAVLVVYFILAKFGGPPIGFVGILLFFNQPIFHQYAAENRPYMLWLGLFLIVLLSGGILAVKFSKAVLALFSVFSILLTFVAGPGMLEVAAVCAVLYFVPHFKNFRKDLAGLTILCIGIGFFYSRNACVYKDGGAWDLLNTRDLNLVKDVVALFIARHSLIGYAFNILVIVGIASASLRTNKFGPTLAVLCVAQLAVAFILAALIVKSHYYFVPRMFIYLIALRALLVAAGVSFLVDRFRSQVPAVPRLLSLAIAFGLAGMVFKNRAALSEFREEAVKLQPKSLIDPAILPTSGNLFSEDNAVALLNFYAIARRDLSKIQDLQRRPRESLVIKLSEKGYEISEQRQAMDATLCGLPLKF